MDKETLNIINDIVNRLDKKREELKEKYKKTPQYRSSKKYRQVDQRYLDNLLERRNTLVSVLNYDYTKNIKELEDLLN